MMSLPALACGATLAAGAVLLVREMLPARPDLGQVLDRLEETGARPRPSPPAVGGGREAWVEQVGAGALDRFGGALTVPGRDLDLLGIPAARHAGTKIVGAVCGLLLPQLYVVLSALTGPDVSMGVPVLMSLAAAALLWVNADAHVKKQAAQARLEFRFAIASFLERARLERSAASGAEAAVHRTAAVGDGWIADRLRAALERAHLAGIPPWQALADLGEQLQIPELSGPADSFALAGEGASVREVLATQARTLRTRLQNDKRGEANSASSKAVVPGTMLFAVTLMLLLAPAFATMMAS